MCSDVVKVASQVEVAPPVEVASHEVAIRVTGLGKAFKIHERPSDRLKEMIMGRLRPFLGLRQREYSREFHALQSITFELRKGETAGIIGRNGSGKSTLLQIICGTLTPTDGSVEVNGRVAALLELGSGFNPEFTGRENVYMNGAILGLSEAEIDSKFASIHAFSEIGDFIERPVKTYSSGMMVRLAFAVIAHVNADILVIDEALSVGDAFFVQKCMRFLRKFMETGTVLFVSHDTGAVVNLCNQAVWLEAGKLVAQGHPKEISEAYLQKQYESMQEVVIKQTSAHHVQPPDRMDTVLSPAVRDMRTDIINNSDLRNDIEVFSFDERASGFGAGGAKVVQALLTDQHNAPLSWIVGGEVVCLHVEVSAVTKLSRPIVGFIVRDRLGQALFGDNTYISHKDRPVAVPAGDRLSARFTFQMPRLPRGDYTLSLAVADGTQLEHTQHCWLHDALSFKSHSTSVTTGLVGVPVQEIILERR
ncbi:ABC transporter ATP-binding protein [Rhizobium ruizarguesonis]|nr:ABC transporter ATP-binding protein [Rhizobium ruizarguesonis]TAZ98376.1 ABC transporter ATP-binding protein [Rhizobium ruizarguesonis]TBA14979.1 ABC transporter ATP-binding protein [Rhizobium ruizarguesonis]TBB85779.1 ABC transporter ATP-binding protein [Rhizobium ruizarguesonis]TBC19146.1 ABC transporter ATP-binding protein [Rhizobium ruizarguesonis]